MHWPLTTWNGWLRERRLRKDCRRELQALGVQPPLDVNELCTQLGHKRGRPLRLVPYPLPVPGPYGAWVATRSADYILYQQETSKAHQDHIILHEVGHILAGHRGESANECCENGAELDDPGAPGPDTVQHVLRRTSYDEAREHEAELIATIILEWASVLDPVAAPPAAQPDLRRVQTALGDRRGWL
ncbi:hypothetical protein [Streptomyces sp. CMSTAAHL-2]|uniref:hypothetical protein n=1 Tax=Streptomyces sp. CMSTAAHL-2 TaxID=2904522 RepID=UPI001E375F29|nr:hypothetical protein [Streptomyces sp. CMSTAAHL-2]MCE3031988.1 hypothetical protein [Streptomyces sp. CMSTAAHL-2]